MRDETRMARGAFWGDVLRAAHVGGLTLTEVSYEASLRVPPHRHESAYMSLVLSGGYEETLQHETRTCSAGTVTFHGSCERHGDRFGSRRTTIFTVEFDEPWLANASQCARLLDGPAAFGGGAIVSLLTRMSDELRMDDDVSSLAIEGLALEAVAEASRRARSGSLNMPPSWLVQARSLIADRFRDRLTLRSIAAAVGVHPLHLVREFRRYYGHTVGETIRAHRVEMGSHLLRTSWDSIASIAVETGFAHQSHFTTVFKRLTGVTPGAFRRQHRGSDRNVKTALASR